MTRRLARPLRATLAVVLALMLSLGTLASPAVGQDEDDIGETPPVVDPAAPNDGDAGDGDSDGASGDADPGEPIAQEPIVDEPDDDGGAAGGDDLGDDTGDDTGSDGLGDDGVDDGLDDDGGDDDGLGDDGVDDGDGALDDGAGVAPAAVASAEPPGGIRYGDDDDEGFRVHQVIVRLVSGADGGSYAARHDATVLAAIPSRNLYLLQTDDAIDELSFAQTLQTDPETAWADVNYVHQAPEGRPRRFYPNGGDGPVPVAGPGGYAPALLGLETAWRCGDGAGVVVAVIDTGVDPAHPALAGRLLPGWNALAGNGDVGDYGNGLDDDADGLIDEMTGHGTHVAGIVAQVAPGAPILPIKALDSDGVGDAFLVAAAIYHAIDSGASVINLSLGSTQNTQVLAEAVAAASGAGRFVVAAAGNLNTVEPREYPASHAGAYAVAATDAGDRKSDFSNYGPIFVSAPGSDIVSAFPGGGYATWSGTSMATPFVAGTAALVLGAGGGDAAGRLAAAADSLDALNPDYAGLLGAGRVDAAAATGCGDAPAPSPSPDPEPEPMPSPSPSPGPSESPTTTTGVIDDTNGAGANCRNGPSTSAGVITLLPEGSSVPITGPRVGRWQPVLCAGVASFVNSTYIEIVELERDDDDDDRPQTRSRRSVLRDVRDD